MFCGAVGTAGMLMGVATEFRAVPEEVARQTARRLASGAGIFAGWSSGLNVTAALDIARELGPGHTVVTVACDSGLKYLNGPLYA